jgi:hypothetical protein
MDPNITYILGKWTVAIVVVLGCVCLSLLLAEWINRRSQ